MFFTGLAKTWFASCHTGIVLQSSLAESTLSQLIVQCPEVCHIIPMFLSTHSLRKNLKDRFIVHLARMPTSHFNIGYNDSPDSVEPIVAEQTFSKNAFGLIAS